MPHLASVLLLAVSCFFPASLAMSAERRPGKPHQKQPSVNLYDPSVAVDFAKIDPRQDPGPDPIFMSDPRLNRTETYVYRETGPGDHELPRGTGVVRYDVTGKESLAQVLHGMRSSLSACTGIAIYLVKGTELNAVDLATVQRLNLATAEGGLNLIGITTLHLYNLKSLAGGTQTTEATINGAFMWNNGWRGSAYKHLVLDDLEEVKDGTFCENRFLSISLRAARSIGVMAFGAARNSHPPLTELYLPSALTIKSHAFRRNRNLMTVNLPRATFLDSYAFDDCDRILYVNAPELTDMGRNVFNDNGSVVSVNLPKLETTGVASWGGPGRMRVLRLPSLRKSNDLNVMETTQFLYVPRLRSADGLMFAKELRALHAPSLEQVGKGAFVSCVHLRRIDLPSGVNVSPEAFTGLTDVAVTVRGKPFPVPPIPPGR